MPTAPVYKQQVISDRPVATPLQNINVSPAQYGAAIGQSMQEVGKDLAHISAIMQHEDEKAANALELEQQAKVDVEQQNILKEVESLKDDQWRGVSSAYAKRFNDKIVEASKALPPKIQREFIARNSVKHAALDTHLSGLEDKNNFSYDLRLNQSAIDSAKQDAVPGHVESAISGNPEAANKSLAAVVDLVQKRNVLTHATPDEAKMAIGLATSEVRLAAVHNLVITDQFDAADKMVKQGGFTVQHQAAALAEIHSYRVDKHVRDEADDNYVKIVPNHERSLAIGDTAGAQTDIQKWYESSKDPNRDQIRSQLLNKLHVKTVQSVSDEKKRQDIIVDQIRKTGTVGPENKAAFDAYPTDLREALVKSGNDHDSLIINDYEAIGKAQNMFNTADTQKKVEEARIYSQSIRARTNARAMAVLENAENDAKKRVVKDTIIIDKDDARTQYLDAFYRSSGKTPDTVSDSEKLELDNSFNIWYSGRKTAKRETLFEDAQKMGQQMGTPKMLGDVGLFNNYSGGQYTGLQIAAAIQDPGAAGAIKPIVDSFRNWAGTSPESPDYKAMSYLTIKAAKEKGQESEFRVRTMLRGLYNDKKITELFSDAEYDSKGKPSSLEDKVRYVLNTAAKDAALAAKRNHVFTGQLTFYKF
jgi:hypothetical protein